MFTFVGGREGGTEEEGRGEGVRRGGGRRERESTHLYLHFLPTCRHEKVQENCIDLVGRIADRGAEFVPAKEWMRICFELLELLKAHKKAIRRASVNTFGYIAKAIG